MSETAIVDWQEIDWDDRPVYGPPCPGIDTHRWNLAIEGGQMSLYSGCETCDDAVLSPVGGEDVEMRRITGSLRCHVEKAMGEVDVWWEFVPYQNGTEEQS